MDNTGILDTIRNLLSGKGSEPHKVVDTSVSTSNGEPIVTNVVELEKEVAEETTLAEATLEDGTVVYFETLEIGSIVYTDELQTEVLVDGEYVIGNYNVVITEGLVSELTEIEVVEEEEAAVVEAEAAFTVTADEFSVATQKITDLEAQLLQVTTDKDVLALFVEDLKKEVEGLEAEPLVKPITQATPATRELTLLEKRMESLSALRAIKKN